MYNKDNKLLMLLIDYNGTVIRQRMKIKEPTKQVNKNLKERNSFNIIWDMWF